MCSKKVVSSDKTIIAFVKMFLHKVKRFLKFREATNTCVFPTPFPCSVAIPARMTTNAQKFI